jgi:hypothetical protein
LIIDAFPPSGFPGKRLLFVLELPIFATSPISQKEPDWHKDCGLYSWLSTQEQEVAAMNASSSCGKRSGQGAPISKAKRTSLVSRRSDVRMLLYFMEHDRMLHPQEWQILSLQNALHQIDEELNRPRNPKGSVSHDRSS